MVIFRRDRSDSRFHERVNAGKVDLSDDMSAARAHSDLSGAVAASRLTPATTKADSEAGGDPPALTVVPAGVTLYASYPTYRTRSANTINYFILPNLIVHIIGLAALLALWYYLRFTNVFPYHHRVFYCRDIFLYKPNFQPEDFEIYVSDALLYVFGFFIPPIVIVIGEIMFWLFSTKPRKCVYATCQECKIHLITRRIIRFLAVFLFGALITQIFVDIIKLMTGYQRPYFLSLCNVSLIACTAPLDYSPSPSPHLACNYRNADELRYAWLTFPSFHAAFSSYSACFASCYIYYMISVRGAPLLRPMLIFSLMSLALIDAFSRINGYKNHWRDVWVGWLIGAGIALLLCFSVLCFQEIYHVVQRPFALRTVGDAPPPPRVETPPFFSWFRLPRVHAPSVKEEYVIYEEEIPSSQTAAPVAATRRRHQVDQERQADRTYEVITTTESYHRTIGHPPQHNVSTILTNDGVTERPHYRSQ